MAARSSISDGIEALREFNDNNAEWANALERIPLLDDEFEDIRRLVYDAFGISLADHKRSLVKSRLQKHLLNNNFRSYREYIEEVRKDRTGEELSLLANRISTNYTYFYRENQHFEYMLSHALPNVTADLRSQGSKDLRVWCAGCSTGEEPYTLTMLLMDFLGNEYRQWDAGLLATDISTRALTYATKGIYPLESVKRLPPKMLQSYFDDIGGDQVRVKESVRKEVLFRRFNLMQERFSFRKPFQVIFCRNVMIYFDQKTRDALVRRYADSLMPGGYLFIGHSETLGRGNEFFEYIIPAVYRKVRK